MDKYQIVFGYYFGTLRQAQGPSSVLQIWNLCKTKGIPFFNPGLKIIAK